VVQEQEVVAVKESRGPEEKIDAHVAYKVDDYLYYVLGVRTQ